MEFAGLIRDVAAALARDTEATAATLLLQLSPDDAHGFLLDGVGQPPPEFGDAQTASGYLNDLTSDASGRVDVAAIPSTDADCVILRLPQCGLVDTKHTSRRGTHERRRDPDIATGPRCDGVVWAGLRGVPLDQASAAPFAADSGSFEAITLRGLWLAYYLSRLQKDPVTGLTGRRELQAFLERAVAAGRGTGQSLGLLLLNPDDFSMINHRYGRADGDLALGQVAERLAGCLRETDGIFHYGGAVFAAVLPATDAEQARTAAEKVRSALTGERFVDGDVALTFSLGVAVADAARFASAHAAADQLTQRADAALNAARLSGGSRLVVAHLDDVSGHEMWGPLDRIFAADTEKDYRNMLLLWESVGLISGHTDPERIARAFVERIAIGFRADVTALARVDDGTVETDACCVRDPGRDNGIAAGAPLDLDDQGRALLDEAMGSGRVARFRGDDRMAFAVPLIAGEERLGCLYLAATKRRWNLDSSDVVFLNALASQMAVAIDRANLANRELRQRDVESRQLREEVRGLRQALHHNRVIYQSDAMESVMETIRRVAPSDATVLIVGESGTGKEMLARSLHEFSERRERPYVVFDCGAVAHSLLESELFGHEKGSFTGADKASAGSIGQAQGGTLFLDEIGELPLAAQSALLRFVQEKTYSRVGSSQTLRADVRIVAATNRRLQDEVAAGRFRSDLYYRLRVISIQAVPLRERRDDVLPLATTFLERFASQYGMQSRRLTPEAEYKLVEYDWPGNVRELQNCILRSFLTSDADVLDADAIDLGSDAVSAHVDHTPPPAPGALPPPAQTHGGDPWAGLESALTRQVELALERERRRPAPLGRWLNNAFVLEAYRQSRGVARRAADLVGVAESTYRRHLDKAQSAEGVGPPPGTAGWDTVDELVRSAITRAVRDRDTEDSLLDRARAVLLEVVRSAVDDRFTPGAALMGVSPPTFKRWLRESEHGRLA